ncbi:MAG: FAD-dependent oxidoreductase [Deltaproteobacteria bacterium]|nr:FAD-dependent oxidoreductase [Deltaproteobacteria bacterium]HCH65418.1 NAD(P)/FAD-dependent oxidoreductase [Deltaproteobacteria bacterium]
MSATYTSQIAEPTAATRARVTNEVPDSVDVAIIGAGLGGLMTAARLAKQGRQVAVFDGHYVAGGCATMFARHTRNGTYRFDIGLHYVGDCGPDGTIPRLLRDVGIELDWIEMSPDGFDVAVLPGLRFPIPSNRDVYRDRLVELFPRETRGIDRYVRVLKEVNHIAEFMEAQKDAGKKAGPLNFLWNIAAHGRLLPRYQSATVADLLDDCTQDPMLRAVLLTQTGDYGVPPSRASALLHCGLANHYFKGAYYPRGGGQVIADQLCEVIEGHGGTIHLRRPIDRILVEKGQAVGVQTAPRRQDPKPVRAKAVVSNADLIHTLDDLLPRESVPQDWQARRAKLEMGGAIFITCLGIEGDLAAHGMGAHNEWCFDSPDVEGIYTDIAGGRIDPRCAYITSASLKDPHTGGHAPPGVQTVEVMTIVPAKPEHWGITEAQVQDGSYRKVPEYLEKKRVVEDGCIRWLDEQHPGLAEKVVFRESATPATQTRYTRAAGGTGYGLAATPEQFMDKRPGSRGPIPGLYLAGASTRSGHGIVGALSSGKVAAHRVGTALGSEP